MDGTEGDNTEVQALRAAMEKMRLEHEQAMADLIRRLEKAASQQVTVQVQAPAPLPRLRIFTGLPPTNPQEATYEEWRSQVGALVHDATILDPLGLLRRSFRGVASNQCEQINFKSANELLKRLDALFGIVQTADDLYLELCQLQQGRQQTAADFLTLQCGRLQTVRDRAGFDSSEFHRRLYLVFSKACTNDNLTRELRGRFGIPGEASPTFEELLKYVRRIESLEGPRGKRSSNLQPQLLMQVTNEDARPNQQRPKKGPRRPRYCFHCGQPGHQFKECQNPPDPALVAEREQERRRANNEWRKQKGLPTLPLN